MADEYIDLLITERNFTLNSGDEPTLCYELQSIAQDCVHSIIESGLATQLIAERSPILRADIRLQIETLIERDERIIPGTVTLTEERPTRLFIHAITYDFGEMGTEIHHDD